MTVGSVVNPAHLTDMRLISIPPVPRRTFSSGQLNGEIVHEKGADGDDTRQRMERLPIISVAVRLGRVRLEPWLFSVFPPGS